jgi:catechol 2,3-dioxygenase-like lactoylglutathione lyase family enzyme
MKFIVHLPWQYFIDVAKVMPRFGKDINGNNQAGVMRLCFANARCWLAYARFASVRGARIPARGEKVMQVSKDSIDLGIVVTDEKAALAFYRDLLGLEWEGELPVPGGRMYRLKCGTTVIKLLKLDRTPEAKPAPGGPAGGLGLRYFTISVPDIRGLMAQLEAKGVRPTVSVREARPGVTIAMVTDPDGNTVEFLQNTASR